MKVLLVNGGPHKDGCTNLALEEVAKTLNNENTLSNTESKLNAIIVYKQIIDVLWMIKLINF